MNNFTVIGIVLLLLSTCISCEKDDELILGKWEMDRSSMILYDEDGVEVFNETRERSGYFWKFLADGTGEETQDGNNVVGFYSWDIVGSELTRDDELFTQVYTIETLSKSTLKLNWSNSYTDDGIDFLEEGVVSFTKVR